MKCLFCGRLQDTSSISIVEDKVNNLLEKRPNFFDVLIIIGPFHISIELNVDIKVIVFGEANSVSEGIQLFKSSTSIIMNDISFAYFDGKLMGSELESSMIKGFKKPLDVLIVADWPYFSPVNGDSPSVTDRVIKTLQPRYIFISNSKNNFFSEKFA